MEQLVRDSFLEMTSESRAIYFSGETRLDVRQAEIPCPETSRFFYTTVGADWGWYDRLGWDRERWLAHPRALPNYQAAGFTLFKTTEALDFDDRIFEHERLELAPLAPGVDCGRRPVLVLSDPQPDSIETAATAQIRS